MSESASEIERLIRQRAGEHPDEVWLKYRDERYTWRDVLSYSQRVAQGLAALGAKPGDRIAIMLSNRPEFLWAHFGIIFLGAHSVPVNIHQRGAALKHILDDSAATVLIHEAALTDSLSKMQSAISSLRVRVVVGDTSEQETVPFDHLLLSPDARLPVEGTGPVGTVGLLYTSGTTGPPKGVVATRYDLSSLRAILDEIDVQPGETMYTCLPLFHGNALMISVVGSIFLDARLALGERFSARGFWEEVRNFRAVQFNTLGSMIAILMKSNASTNDREHSVRTVLSAGCPADLWRPFEERFGVHVVEFFGMVDSPGFLINREGRVGSMGTPVGGVEFRVVDANDAVLPPGRVGELVFRHPEGQLTHYEKQPAATAEAYRGGWFHSGDFAECDSDGFLYYRGRKTQSIRRRGENISAWEIESVLARHPAVLECAAHAVPSDLADDDVKVAVVVHPQAQVDAGELLDFCQGRMADYAVPRYVELLDALPKTGTHRVNYPALVDRGLTTDTWDRLGLLNAEDAPTGRPGEL